MASAKRQAILKDNVLNVAKPDGYYRHDGVRITHDPYSAAMKEKYGSSGGTDREGFDPYADSVGAGIYSGTVKRRESGAVVIGEQYQNHNPTPGPVYAGGGYTPVSQAIAKFQAEAKQKGGAAATSLAKLLDRFPDLVNDVSTGGALPLHTCGMSGDNQHAAAFLVSRGADIEGLDTYGFTPLHRMASNNLAVGARAVLEAGADPAGLASVGIEAGAGTPAEVARESRAAAVLKVLKEFPTRRTDASTAVSAVEVLSAGYQPVLGRYTARGAGEIPAGFADVCRESDWDVEGTWAKLNGSGGWFKHEASEAYIYFNLADRHWWLDGPDGMGAFKARGPSWAPPAAATAWESLLSGELADALGPTLAVHRG